MLWTHFAGDDNICITKGVVSRIEFRRYSHSKTSLMTIQTDAAINHGNSGGPAFTDNKVVGVAFQSNKNTGWVETVNLWINGDKPSFFFIETFFGEFSYAGALSQLQ